MKIAAPFAASAKWRKVPDEYNISIENSRQIEAIYDFLEVTKKRVNLNFKNEIDLNCLEILIKKYSNFVLRVHSYQIKNLKRIKELNIPFFFDRDVPCTSLLSLDFMIKQKVTDVYIFDDLWYNLPQVSEKCKNNNINIRLILNRVPSLFPVLDEDYKAPIFSPRDIEYLEPYIDTIEFDCYFAEEKAYNWNIFNVYKKAYLDKKEWVGDLRELNRDLTFFYPVYSEPWELIKRKISCGRKCSVGSKCRRCEDIVTIARNLNAEGLYLKKNKGEKEELDEKDFNI